MALTLTKCLLTVTIAFTYIALLETVYNTYNPFTGKRANVIPVSFNKTTYYRTVYNNDYYSELTAYQYNTAKTMFTYGIIGKFVIGVFENRGTFSNGLYIASYLMMYTFLVNYWFTFTSGERVFWLFSALYELYRFTKN